MKKNLKLLSHKTIIVIIGVLAIGSLAFAYNSYTSSPKILVEGDMNYTEATNPNGTSNPTGEEQNFGALTGPELPYDHLCLNGACQYASRTPLRAASTTAASMQSPTATSTRVSTTCHVEVASSTVESRLTIAKADNYGATTTAIGNQITIPANAKDDFVASSTLPGAAGEADIFPPNYWVNIGIQGGAPGTTFSPTGYCTTYWKVLE